MDLPAAFEDIAELEVFADIVDIVELADIAELAAVAVDIEEFAELAAGDFAEFEAVKLAGLAVPER